MTKQSIIGTIKFSFTADISPSFIQVYRYPRQLHTAISISINAVQYRQEENHSLEAVDLRGHPLLLLDLSAQQGQSSLRLEVDKMTHLQTGTPLLQQHDQFCECR